MSDGGAQQQPIGVQEFQERTVAAVDLGDSGRTYVQLTLDGVEARLQRTAGSHRFRLVLPLQDIDTVSEKTALLTVQFFDKNNVPLAGPYEDYAQSPAIGFFRYLDFRPSPARLETFVKFPRDAESAAVRIRLWRNPVKPVAVWNKMALIPEGARASISADQFFRAGEFTLAACIYQSRNLNSFRTSRINGWNRFADAGFKLDGERSPSGLGTAMRGIGRIKSVFRKQQLRGIYALMSSLPHQSNGYAVRAQGLLTAYGEMGEQITGCTQYGYPNNISGLSSSKTTWKNDRANYRFAPDADQNLGKMAVDEYVKHASEYYIECAKSHRAEFIKAGSFFTNGAPAAMAARALGIPFIYEMRGMAWLTRGATNLDWMNSEEGTILRDGEISVAKQAQHVFTITSSLRDFLIQHGVKADKISLLPNAVVPEHFPPNPHRDTALEAAMGIKNAFVIGYAGSFVDYEGLELLIEAFSQIESSRAVKLLLIGDGPSFDQVREAADHSPRSADIIITGRVPHDRIRAYYSLFDVSVLPRLPLAVCEMISPLKPFELFAMGIPVISSDVGALREVVPDGERGRNFKAGDAAHLASVLSECIDDPSEIQALASNAHEWVRHNRTWQAVVKDPIAIIKRLIA